MPLTLHESLAGMLRATEQAERPMKGGVFLSETGLKRLERAFFEVQKMPPRERVAFVSAQLKNTALADKSSFDDFYYYLYLSNIANVTSIDVDPQPMPGLSKLFGVRAILDLEFKRYDHKAQFEQTLIDEALVSRVLLCARAVKRLIPYASYIEQVGLGCAWLDVGVYGDCKTFNLKSDLPSQLRTELEGQAAEKPSRAWRLVKERFKVASIELYPAPR